MRHDYAHDTIEARARQEQVPAAYHLLQLSGCLGLRAQAVRATVTQLGLEGLDESLYHCETTGRDLSTDAVAAACGMLAVAANDIAARERGDVAAPQGDHECQCQQHDCRAGVTCATAASHEFCDGPGLHVCGACEAHQ